MNYEEIIAKLKENREKSAKMLESGELSKEELESIKKTIDNYNYIIELTEMNHFERGM